MTYLLYVLLVVACIVIWEMFLVGCAILWAALHPPAAEVDDQPDRIPALGEDINVLVLVKGSERYVFLYDDLSRKETLRMLGRYAKNPALSFTWYDAAVLSQKMREESGCDLFT